jgi:hypothetical protein
MYAAEASANHMSFNPMHCLESNRLIPLQQQNIITPTRNYESFYLAGFFKLFEDHKVGASTIGVVWIPVVR